MSIRCWWFGHYSPGAPDYTQCIHCGGSYSYADAVGDTRHNRFTAWARHWLWRKWWPKKCTDCGGRWRHDETKDHIPF